MCSLSVFALLGLKVIEEAAMHISNPGLLRLTTIVWQISGNSCSQLPTPMMDDGGPQGAPLSPTSFIVKVHQVEQAE